MKHDHKIRALGGNQNADGDGDKLQSPSRRKLLVGGAVAGAALMVGSRSIFAATPRPSSDNEIRIGFISPRSGPFGSLDASDPYMLKLIRGALAGGIEIRGQTYRVKILDRDSQSSPSRASQLARDLINRDHIHLMLTTTTPGTVNPVSDACEAAGVPSVGTGCPLESFFFGRGGKMGQPSPFKWSFGYSFGIGQIVEAYLGQWHRLQTNRKVAVMYPNDADGSGFRHHLAPILEKNGYKIIDPGAYTDGTTDFSSQIALFKREKCEIYNGVGLPPDIQRFWRQSAQLRLLDNMKIAQFSKAGSVFGEIMALGPLGYNIASLLPWSPVYPYRSPLTGGSSRELAEGYQKTTHRIWAPGLGLTLSLFEVGIHILKAAQNPLDHSAIRDVIPKLDMLTTVGRINFKRGPYPNTAGMAMLGAQWVKIPSGSKFPLDFVVTDNTEDRNVPVQRKLVPYHA